MSRTSIVPPNVLLSHVELPDDKQRAAEVHTSNLCATRSHISAPQGGYDVPGLFHCSLKFALAKAIVPTCQFFADSTWGDKCADGFCYAYFVFLLPFWQRNPDRASIRGEFQPALLRPPISIFVTNYPRAGLRCGMMSALMKTGRGAKSNWERHEGRELRRTNYTKLRSSLGLTS